MLGVAIAELEVDVGFAFEYEVDVEGWVSGGGNFDVVGTKAFGYVDPEVGGVALFFEVGGESLEDVHSSFLMNWSSSWIELGSLRSILVLAWVALLVWSSLSLRVSVLSRSGISSR